MNRRLRYQLLFVSLAAISISGASYFGWTQSRAANATDPAIKLLGIDGQTYNLGEMRGNAMLVSFGATWCVPCTAELRALEELKREYANQPVKFFWASIESEEQITNAGLKRYAKERKLTMPVLRDPSKSVYLRFTSRVRLPMILFLDKEGHIDAPAQFGMRSPVDLYKADIRTRLKKLLALPSPIGRRAEGDGAKRERVQWARLFDANALSPTLSEGERAIVKK